ncbi:MAG: hypothetical protein U0269_31640 [Polyangiales bacterium]
MSSDAASVPSTRTLVESRFFTPQGIPTILHTSDGLLAVASDWRLSLLDPETGLVRRVIEGTQYAGPNHWALDPTETIALRSDYRGFERIDLASGERTPIELPPERERTWSVNGLHCERSLEDRVLVFMSAQPWRFLSTRTWEYGVALEGSEYHSQQPLLRAIVCSSRGRRVVLRSENQLTLFDGESGRKLGLWSVQSELIHSAAFSKDERALLVCTSSRLLHLDPDTLELVSERKLLAQQSFWGALIAVRAGLIYAWTLDEVRVFDLETLELRAQHATRCSPTAGFEFSDGASWLATQDGAIVRLDDGRPAEHLAASQPAVRHMAFDPSGERVIVVRDRAVIERLTVADASVERVGAAAWRWAEARLSPDTSRVHFAYGSMRTSDGAVEERPRQDDALIVYGDGEQRATLIAGGVRLSPSGQDVAIEGFPTKTKGVTFSGAFSRNGRWVVVLSGPRAAVIDTATFAVVATCKSSGVHGAFVADNGFAVALSYATVHVFGPDSKPQNIKLDRTTGMCATIAPNRALSIAGLLDGRLCVADLTTPKRSAIVPLCGGYVRAVSISPDETQLVVATGDNDIVLLSVDELAARLPAAKSPAKKKPVK